ncbi:N-carbamoylputrescine amidase [Clostridium intestinale]|uniref:N-carbamoylputrescine amidase n=1 Tax=Clostridium intestinale DSM 6191 TaxID=1121320 RepID=A0A1M6BQ11_9CLOT|nr:N-carbamoylputrescine amidase [Clostridium intestinale]WRY51525.1 N-carbamoylputrescine amidase [Clostridium intestinale]SHI50704.1 N-carbamoylputrescine amidase [Clostridium intestinale DSM 6191]
MRNVTVGATQMKCTDVVADNIRNGERLVREAVKKGANIVLLQELFENLYFCQKQVEDYFKLAKTLEDSDAVNHFKNLAKELQVVLPISFFEKKNNMYYNSLVVIDADGEILGTYRKTHIPDGPGYNEKFYFSPGDTGFKVFKTKYGTIGIGICWDQWFPETARSLALMGAELIFYPTAIGSEPSKPEYDSRDHWQRVMQGHSAANIVPVIASNRIGTEHIQDSQITFYGSSFITNEFGEKVVEANREEETVLTATFDLDKIAEERSFWGIFRDRRPSLYGTISTKDGSL